MKVKKLDILEREIRAIARDVRRDEPLSRHVSFHIGGPADLLVIPQSLEELRRVMAFLYKKVEIPVVVLGRGSNVLISDQGVRGVVVKVGRGVDAIAFSGTSVVAEAGAFLPTLANQAASRGLSGLEFCAGIPASLGGAVVMNAGAHGHCIAEVVRRVHLITPSGEEVVEAESLGFGYRRSVLQEKKAVVVMAELELDASTPEEVRARTERWLRQRNATQPIGPPSSGCIFRNPPGDHAGRLIDLAGAKGLQIGGARVSEVHANYILNVGGATASDVLALMEEIIRLVRNQFGVVLEPEIKLVGDFSG
ncbi:MAG: UDP-N-acetylmuramate dehydrogenase [Armatimonadota bacterium]|nr:UDP-N-acetylmuramate dehydrogenase [Armatimonadota bacterium]